MQSPCGGQSTEISKHQKEAGMTRRQRVWGTRVKMGLEVQAEARERQPAFKISL